MHKLPALLLALLVAAMLPVAIPRAVMGLERLYVERNWPTGEVDGMAWQSGGGTLRAQVQRSLEGEEERLLLHIVGPSGNNVFEKGLGISWDMWGAGFLKAMQADNDPELEVVFYTKGGDRPQFKAEYFSDPSRDIPFNFYLDIRQGQAVPVDFGLASPEARHYAGIYLASTKALSLTVLLLLAAPGAGFAVYWLLSRQRHGKPAPVKTETQ